MGVTIQVHQILDVAIPTVRVIGPGVQRGVWPSLARREHLLLSSHQQPAATWLEQFVSMFPVVSYVGLHHFIARGR